MSNSTFPAMEACGNLIRTARAADGSGGWHVAEVAVTHIEGEASRRARLFAAAPDLFYAAHQALALIGAVPHGDNCFVSNHYTGDPGDRCNCGKDSAIQALDDALNKATEA